MGILAASKNRIVEDLGTVPFGSCLRINGPWAAPSLLFLLDAFDGVDAEAGEFLCLLEIGLADLLPPLL